MPRQMQEARYRVSDRGLRDNRTIHLCRFSEPALGIPLEEHEMQLTLESAVKAIAQVQAAYNCSDLEAITMMQGAAAKAGDEASLECLCLIKANLLGL